MIPAARLQAAIEILDQVITAARDGGAAADTIIQRYFSTRRYAGSKDRRAVRDLVFAVIRSLGERPVSGRAAVIGHARAHDPELLALFGAGGHGPPTLVHGEPAAVPGVAPAWLERMLIDRFGADAERQALALLDRAPLDVRVNALRATRAAVLADHADWENLPSTAHGVRLPSGTNVEALPEYQAGQIEVQDAGSQIAAALLAARPGETVVDLCAGAGGKTLALAADMGGPEETGGRLIACDTDRARLSQLAPRAERAGAAVETRLLNPGAEAQALADLMGQCDAVLIDAPCSGSGTWRRNPESRWRLTPQRLQRLVATQAMLLQLGTALLRPGGRLVYIVCSLLPAEGEAQLAATPGLSPWQTRVLTPADDGCDGFFIAQSSRL
ncbi:RsmB/NOP family class I SAM-dependent RNA methyltransferase [Sandarakinorhabdus oryzae]|uniref:RsmB/NOP family class I SAM-dependent RNA methyltransferase n=1 Tax=Sandarakinorhabdus oryzae TaxID=2675220 RepID=UPI0012E31B51|nr:RsmB/NOP family class I SAM-dependent RNA methyltransferase [Sandarakinorhabdus oryzae]